MNNRQISEAERNKIVSEVVENLTKYFREEAHYEELCMDVVKATSDLFILFDEVDRKGDEVGIYADMQATSGMMYDHRRLLEILRPLALLPPPISKQG